ncbi:alpha/beta hydrolase family protein [Paraliomyxa miuraensis]|uniref:alpha/beta hydrolase family protein n=1 Tax=Paraliomyxa miuraensis TaxID=376150 RepID=UPI0022588055|nr:alpha/beta hydrolase [Paraliomyxa miuraensis]MCX4242961.1 alpha/beta hydrolase [Paraliomyxa miuraensis]
MPPLTTRALPLLVAGLGTTMVLCDESALAVVVDIAMGGMVLLVLALVLAELARRRGARTAAVVTALVSITALGFAVVQRWGRISCESVQVSSGSVTLAGTVCRPRGSSDAAGAVLVHGSGPATRDEFSSLARLLARRGIAAVAYDKRGAGESTGETHGGPYRDYAQDAAAMLRHLQAVPGVDPTRVGLVGISEAEWVMPQVPTLGVRPAFIVVIGASGVSPLAQVNDQIRLRLERNGFDPAAVDAAVAFHDRYHEYLRGAVTAETMTEELRAARAEGWYAAAGKLPDAVHPREEYAWWIGVMDLDPTPLWQRIDVPVLVLKGEADDRSDASRAVAAIERALHTGGNEHVRTEILPGADHSLLRWPLGERVPPPRFADGYPESMVAWILEVATRIG